MPGSDAGSEASHARDKGVQTGRNSTVSLMNNPQARRGSSTSVYGFKGPSKPAKLLPDDDYEDIDYSFRIAVVGDAGVGKSAVLDRELGVYVPNHQQAQVKPWTRDSLQPAILFKNKPYIFQGYIVLVEFWDLPGAADVHTDTVRYCDDMAGYVLVFDGGLASIENWARDLGMLNPKTGAFTKPTVVLGNKIDVELQSNNNIALSTTTTKTINVIPVAAPSTEMVEKVLVSKTNTSVTLAAQTKIKSTFARIKDAIHTSNSTTPISSLAKSPSGHGGSGQNSANEDNDDEDDDDDEQDNSAKQQEIIDTVRKISFDTALTWAENRGADYYDVSAWTNENIQDAIGALVLSIVRCIPDEYELQAKQDAAVAASMAHAASGNTTQMAIVDPYRDALLDLRQCGITPRKFRSNTVEGWWRKLIRSSGGASTATAAKALEEQTTTHVDWM